MKDNKDFRKSKNFQDVNSELEDQIQLNESSLFFQTKLYVLSSNDSSSICDRVSDELECFDILMEEMITFIPCRVNQISALLKYFHLQPLPPCIFVNGHTATGKSLVVTTVLERLSYVHAVVNCIDCFSLRGLLERILDKLLKKLPTTQGSIESSYKCDNTVDFIQILQNTVTQSVPVMKTPLVIVLDNCEYLKNIDSNLLRVLLQLQYFTKLNICVVIISSNSWESLTNRSYFPLPLEVSFPQYSRDELLTILMQDRPTAYSCDQYRSYIRLLLGLCYRYCRIIPELRYVAHINLEKLPEISSDSSQEMWHGVKLLLKDSLKSLFLHFTNKGSSNKQNCIVDKHSLTNNLTDSRFTLPLYAKYILIAAYLAAHVPPALDKQYFMKHREDRKRKKSTKTNRKLDVQTYASTPFSYNRLIAIFYTIIEEPVNLSILIETQVSTLVQLKMLGLDGPDNLTASYRCLVGLDFILPVAKQVGFNISKFLSTE